MIEKPLISIVIPTYNSAQFVGAAVESVLKQTYSHFEIIVVDDGSTDNTASVLAPYKDRIQYIKKQNGGPASARNIGIKQARGEYVAFLDADDVWLPPKLETQLDAMNGDIALVGEGDFHKGECSSSRIITYKELLQKNYFCNSSVIVKKSCFDEVGLYNESPEFKAVEDWDMWLRIANKFPVQLLPSNLVQIRQVPSSLSSTENALKMLNNEKAVLMKHFSHIKVGKISFVEKREIFSYRYFCAAWAFWSAKELSKAFKYMLISFTYNPLSLLTKKRGGLMIKIILERILRLSIPVNQLTRPFFSFLYHIHVFLREGLICLIKFFYYEPLFRSQCQKAGQGLWMEKLPYIIGQGVIEIGNNVRLSGKPSFAFSRKICKNPKLSIGNNTFIGHQTSFMVAKEIRIGNHCYIAGGVTIADNDGHPIDADKRRQGLPPDKDAVREVIIGDDVWIGRQAMILKGVTIGNRSIVGGRAVVVHDVPEDSIVAGNPAKVITKIERNV